MLRAAWEPPNEDEKACAAELVALWDELHTGAPSILGCGRAGYLRDNVLLHQLLAARSPSQLQQLLADLRGSGRLRLLAAARACTAVAVEAAPPAPTGVQTPASSPTQDLLGPCTPSEPSPPPHCPPGAEPAAPRHQQQEQERRLLQRAAGQAQQHAVAEQQQLRQAEASAQQQHPVQPLQPPSAPLLDYGAVQGAGLRLPDSASQGVQAAAGAAGPVRPPPAEAAPAAAGRSDGGAQAAARPAQKASGSVRYVRITLPVGPGRRISLGARGRKVDVLRCGDPLCLQVARDLAKLWRQRHCSASGNSKRWWALEAGMVARYEQQEAQLLGRLYAAPDVPDLCAVLKELRDSGELARLAAGSTAVPGATHPERARPKRQQWPREMEEPQPAGSAAEEREEREGGGEAEGGSPPPHHPKRRRASAPTWVAAAPAPSGAMQQAAAGGMDGALGMALCDPAGGWAGAQRPAGDRSGQHAAAAARCAAGTAPLAHMLLAAAGGGGGGGSGSGGAPAGRHRKRPAPGCAVAGLIKPEPYELPGGPTQRPQQRQRRRQQPRQRAAAPAAGGAAITGHAAVAGRLGGAALDAVRRLQAGRLLLSALLLPPAAQGSVGAPLARATAICQLQLPLAGLDAAEAGGAVLVAAAGWAAHASAGALQQQAALPAGAQGWLLTAVKQEPVEKSPEPQQAQQRPGRRQAKGRPGQQEQRPGQQAQQQQLYSGAGVSGGEAHTTPCVPTPTSALRTPVGVQLSLQLPSQPQAQVQQQQVQAATAARVPLPQQQPRQAQAQQATPQQARQQVDTLPQPPVSSLSEHPAVQGAAAAAPPAPLPARLLEACHDPAAQAAGLSPASVGRFLAAYSVRLTERQRQEAAEWLGQLLDLQEWAAAAAYIDLAARLLP